MPARRNKSKLLAFQQECERERLRHLQSIPELQGIDLSTLSEDEIDGIRALHIRATQQYQSMDPYLKEHGLKPTRTALRAKVE